MEHRVIVPRCTHLLSCIPLVLVHSTAVHVLGTVSLSRITDGITAVY